MQSTFSTVGLSIRLWHPLITITEGTPNQCLWIPKHSQASFDADENVSDYSHTIVDVGGYDTASVTMTDDQIDMVWWLQWGLGMHLEVRDASAEVIWEGFVDTVSATFSGLAVTIGPIVDMGNRVSVVYTPTDLLISGEVQQVPEETIYVEDFFSQSRYGIQHLLLNASKQTAVSAALLRDKHLADRKDPAVSQDWSSTPGDPAITLGCKGYYHLLNWPYHNATIGSQTVSAKIADILDADINGLFSSANADLMTMTTLVPTQEEQTREAWAILQSLVSLGDNFYRKTLFMVGPDQYVTYGTRPTEVRYESFLSDPKQAIQNYGGGDLQKWQIRPGNWVQYNDLMAGFGPAFDLAERLQVQYISKVSFSAPDSLQLQGGSSFTVPQVLAQFGIAGE